jgi:hypothetical protein
MFPLPNDGISTPPNKDPKLDILPGESMFLP